MMGSRFGRHWAFLPLALVTSVACSAETDGATAAAQEDQSATIQLASGTGDYPTAEVYSAFVEMCSSFDTLNASADAALAADWTEIDRNQMSGLSAYAANILERTESALDRSGNGSVSFASFTKDVAGEGLLLTLVQIQSERTNGAYCILQDPGETRAPDNAVITADQSEPNTTTEIDGISLIDWVGAFGGEVFVLNFGFIPQGNPTAESFNMLYDGLLLESRFSN